MTDALMERGKSEMMVITAQGEVMGGARGVLYIAEKTGAKLLATILGSPLLFWAVDLGYKLVARHRTLVSRVFFKSSTACGMENRFPEVD
jgi:predicted DCC family thiol-disulfide oxidoreductase YuxK